MNSITDLNICLKYFQAFKTFTFQSQMDWVLPLTPVGCPAACAYSWLPAAGSHLPSLTSWSPWGCSVCTGCCVKLLKYKISSILYQIAAPAIMNSHVFRNVGGFFVSVYMHVSAILLKCCFYNVCSECPGVLVCLRSNESQVSGVRGGNLKDPIANDMQQ